jgi:hypothetical protein
MGATKTFKRVLPERFTLSGSDLEVRKFIGEANDLFKSYAPQIKQ